jgi:hypothetical protein
MFFIVIRHILCLKYQYDLSLLGAERSSGWQVNSQSETVLGVETCATQFAEAEFCA